MSKDTSGICIESNSALSVDLEVHTGYNCTLCTFARSERYPMLRLTRWTMAHRRIVVVAWIAAAVALLAGSQAIGSRTSNDFSLPGTSSQRAVDLLQSRFAAQAGDADQVVFRARTGKVTAPEVRRVVTPLLARIDSLPHVTAVVSPYAPGTHAVSKDGTIAFATVTFDQRAAELPKAAVDRVIATAQSARSPALQVELGGQAIEQAQQASLGFATAVGLLAAIVILLISLRLVRSRWGCPSSPRCSASASGSG